MVKKRLVWCGMAAAMGLIMMNRQAFAQEEVNTAGRMMQQEQRLTLGGYAQIDYNQPLLQGAYRNGTLDVHRLVLMLGYKFSDRVQFISEVELEHVEEVYVEQAFLQVEILPWLKFRGGLVLIPMGIINEYHEPPTFNGVERPNLDKYIVPTTWREIGAGFTGTFPSAAVSYQVYVVNGFNGYDGNARLSGPNGFRGGRQKGAESFMSAPNAAFRVNYFGISGLQLGVSAYAGRTQSTLYDGAGKSDPVAVARADSSAVGLTLLGADVRYTSGGWRLRGQANYGWAPGAGTYNAFTGSDLGSTMGGWYAEVAYDLFHRAGWTETELIPFVRYEQYNTHASVEEGTLKDPALNRTDITMGIGWKVTPGAVLKMDMQLFGNKGGGSYRSQFNAGVGVWF